MKETHTEAVKKYSEHCQKLTEEMTLSTILSVMKDCPEDVESYKDAYDEVRLMLDDDEKVKGLLEADASKTIISLLDKYNIRIVMYPGTIKSSTGWSLPNTKIFIGDNLITEGHLEPQGRKK